MSEKPEKKSAEEKLEDKYFQLFTSSIFSRSHANIYLNRAKPNVMYCSSINPEELFANVPTIDSFIHRVVSNDIDLWPLWGRLIPLDNVERCCIHLRGVKSIRTICKNNHAEIEKTWEKDEHTGFRYRSKIDKEGRLEEIIPIRWKLSKHYLVEIDRILQQCVDRVDQMPHQHTYALTPQLPKINGLFQFPLYQKETGFGAGIRYMFNDGINAVSVSEYLKRVGVEQADAVFGQDHGVVMGYCRSISDVAIVHSVKPMEVFYSTRQL